MNELVSILIPTYNRADVIEATVRSALSQTWSEIEVVVVDNCSTDDTWACLERLAKRDARIRIHRNDDNIGPVRNWLACVERARGRYAKILWSDDLIAPTFVERCMPFLRDAEVGFVYTAAVTFSGETPQEGGTTSFQLAGARDTVMPAARFIEGVFTDGDFPFSPGCALFRLDDLRANLWRDVPNHVGSDFSKHAIGNDLLAFLLTAHRYRSVALVGEPLSFFRDHCGSISVVAGQGRLLYHYDLVKAYFAASFLHDNRLRRKLNARIKLHLMRFGPAPYGMKTVEDFYPVRGCGHVSPLELCRAIGDLAARGLRRRMSRA